MARGTALVDALFHLGEQDDVRHTLDYAEITKAVAEFAEEKQYKSVEGLAEGIAQVRPIRSFTASTVQGDRLTVQLALQEAPAP